MPSKETTHPVLVMVRVWVAEVRVCAQQPVKGHRLEVGALLGGQHAGRSTHQPARGLQKQRLSGQLRGNRGNRRRPPGESFATYAVNMPAQCGALNLL